MAVIVAAAVGETMTTMAVAVTGLLGGELSQTPIFEGIDGGLHVPLQGHVDLDAVSLQASERPLPKTPAYDDVHRTSIQSPERLAGSVNVMSVPVAGDLHLLGVGIDEGEEGCASKVIRRCSLETPIIEGRYA
jgi:hypothetical protein